MKQIAFALPVFLILMGIEYLFSKKKGTPAYTFSDTVSNMSIGILDRLTSMLCAGFFYFLYDAIQTNYGLFTLPNRPLTWVALFLLVDFLWYWYHRCSHEINLFWTVHVVHHQSEEFNFSVGTRITILQYAVRLLFWSLLPLIGFPTYMIMFVLLLHGTYAFFLHTKFIGKLGFLEKILVTPSNHRVHHASNEHYLDKNYGGFFIIWDRLFGTYISEKEPVKYGLTMPLQSKSLMWQLFHFFVELYFSTRQQKGIRNKIRFLLGKPDLIQCQLRDRLEKVFLSPSRQRKLNVFFRRYICIQIGASITALVLMLYFNEYLDTSTPIVVGILITLTLINCGALLEQKKWIFYLEYVRFIIFISFVLYLQPIPFAWVLGIVIAILSLAKFQQMKRYYFFRLLV